MSDEFHKSELGEPYTSSLKSSLIAIPLWSAILDAEENGEPDTLHDVIIELSILYSSGDGFDNARRKTTKILNQIIESYPATLPPDATKRCGVKTTMTKFAYQHVFARLTGDHIRRFANELTYLKDTKADTNDCPVYRIWDDPDISPQLTESVRAVKSDAALVSFSASGKGICWAVIDSGVNADHPHFQKHENLKINEPLRHCDFVADETDGDVNNAAGGKFRKNQQPIDPNGHGTHVAGIIAGEYDDPSQPLQASKPERGPNNEESFQLHNITKIRGVSPETKIVSLRVLDENGRGKVSAIIAALGYVASINRSSQWPLIHGINLSVGYEFKAEWFACGHSPLCNEVNRLVKMGIPVVTAAGNSGYGKIDLANGQSFRTGLQLSINDPGNAEHAITVGATHRSNPHTYGVSFFSSKGPTGDGRLKPDLVAPGERIISCASGKKSIAWIGQSEIACDYCEESGTSMAAPHVSGALSAFMSIRKEFIGQPEKLKHILLSTCTDLGREKYFQGSGMLDLMRAIQSI